MREFFFKPCCSAVFVHASRAADRKNVIESVIIATVVPSKAIIAPAAAVPSNDEIVVNDVFFDIAASYWSSLTTMVINAFPAGNIVV